MGYKTESNIRASNTFYTFRGTKTQRHRQQCDGCQMEVGEGYQRVNGAKPMVAENDLTLGGVHAVQTPVCPMNQCHPNKCNELIKNT